MRDTKKKKMILKDFDTKLIFKIKEALPALKKVSSKKFDESVDLAITLGVDAKKSDQQVRGVISLPKMPEKKIKVAVFADSSEIENAKKSGADVVGGEDLIEKVKKGEINFEKCISTPKMMVKVSSLGQILGPKGLMPNPKLGTVTNDLVEAVKKVKAGQIEYKTDKAGIVHASIGKVSFSDEELIQNVTFFLNELKSKKPETSKGIFLKKIYINTTMGPGLQLDPSSAM
jgi:large subunit ribosomal protein L1|tara:strand:+ start:2006 stop:2695 length:690 start_codon:yes stop_codon:yes gene_type:complete